MKNAALLTVTATSMAFHAAASPILDVSYTQNNWEHRITFQPIDIPSSAGMVSYFVDGVLLGSSRGALMLDGLLPEDWASRTSIYNPGEHLAWITFQDGTRIDGDEPYYLVAPTGPRRSNTADGSNSSTSIPDSGSTVQLCLGTLIAICLSHKFQ